jgi:hypothetical protein
MYSIEFKQSILAEAAAESRRKLVLMIPTEGNADEQEIEEEEPDLEDAICVLDED